MPDFVYDNTDLAFPKNDFAPLGPSDEEEDFIQAGDWNTVNQAAVDLRGGLRSGKYHGFTAQLADPAPGSEITQTYLWVNDDGELLFKHEGTTVELVPSSRKLIAGSGITINGGAEAALTGDLTIAATGGGGGGFYQTIQNAASGLAQETVLNFDGSELVATAGSGKTNIALAAVLGPKTLRNTAGATDALVTALALSAMPSGTAAAGVGAALGFHAKDSGGNEQLIAQVAAVTTDVTHTSEDAYLRFQAVAGGSLVDSFYGWAARMSVGAVGATQPSATLHVKSESSPGASFYPLIVNKDQAATTNNKLASLQLQGTEHAYLQLDNTSSIDRLQLMMASGKMLQFGAAGTVYMTVQNNVGSVAVSIDNGPLYMNSRNVQATGHVYAGSNEAYDLGQSSTGYTNLYVHYLKRASNSSTSIEIGAGGTHAAATEYQQVVFAAGSHTWASGTVAAQRFFVFSAPTCLGSSATATFTDAATVYVEGPPVASGGNAAITSAFAIWVDAGVTRLDGDLWLNGGTLVNKTAGNETTSASAGSQTLPAQPVGFLSFKDSAGTTRKLPYYA